MTAKAKRWVMGVMAAIMLLIGGVGIGLSFCGRRGPSAEAIRRQKGREIDVTVICETCGAVYKTRMNMSDGLRGVCEKCGDGTVRRAVRCTRCGKVFPITRVDASDAGAHDRRGVLAEQKRCPGCGASSEFFGPPSPQ